MGVLWACCMQAGIQPLFHDHVAGLGLHFPLTLQVLPLPLSLLHELRVAQAVALLLQLILVQRVHLFKLKQVGC